MTIWRWVFKIALQIIPILIGIDWGRPRDTDPLLPPRPKRKKRKYLDYY